jgi:hypothetical protein
MVGGRAKCREHPKYRGVREPLVDCDGCYDLWNYPRLCALGVGVSRDSARVEYVDCKRLGRALGSRMQEFNKLFGIQTMSTFGPYPWDVEAVLRRMGL